MVSRPNGHPILGLLQTIGFVGKEGPVYAPVDICKADGVTLIESSTADSGQSGCNGGDQYMCNCMQPFNDNTDPTLAYGFAAFTAGNEEATDCACYLAEFAHDGSGKAMKRNKLLFQVTNTGGDVNSGNIDFQIPVVDWVPLLRAALRSGRLRLAVG